MTTMTEEPIATERPDTGWQSGRSARRRAARADFLALRPTLLVLGALFVAAALAVGVTLLVWSPASPGDVTVSETDYRIAMATRLPAGHHTIALTNHGKQGHELLVFRTNLPADALPVDANGDVIEESPQLHLALDSGKSLPPGRTQSLPLTLAPGHYVAVCNLPNHYQLGMKLDLTVGQ